MKESKKVRAICEELIAIRISAESCLYHTQTSVGTMCYSMAYLIKEELEKRIELSSSEISVIGISIDMTMTDLKTKTPRTFSLGYTGPDAPQETENLFNEHYACQVLTEMGCYIVDPCSHYQNSSVLQSASMNLTLAPVPWFISKNSAAYKPFLQGSVMTTKKDLEMFGFEFGNVGKRFSIPASLSIQKRDFAEKELSEKTDLFRSYHQHLKTQIDRIQLRKQFKI